MPSMNEKNAPNGLCSFSLLRSAFVFLLCSLIPIATTNEAVDYCAWETFRAKCEKDEVIMMESARYGRMKLGRCVRNDLGFVGCYRDVMHLADVRCSGRRSCDIPIPNSDFDKLQTCLEDLKSYFEAAYSCRKVVVAESKSCRSSKPTKISSTRGFLSNLVTLETGCGSASSPWLIEAKPGQKINITLLNFGIEPHVTGSDSAAMLLPSGSTSCYRFATISEIEQKLSKVVCTDRNTRRQHVYTSTGHVVDVRIQGLPTPNSHGPYFLLEYQLFGCPDPVLPGSAWFKRTDDQIIVGCLGDSQSRWTTGCSGNSWLGQFGSCGDEISDALEVSQTFRFPSILSIAVIISISLVIGILILSLGLIWICRKRPNPSGVIVTSAVPADHNATYSHGSYVKTLIPEGRFPQQDREMGYQRESNDYASIWEWPIQNISPPTASSTADSHGYKSIHVYQQQQQQLQQQQHLLQQQKPTGASYPSSRLMENPYQFPEEGSIHQRRTSGASDDEDANEPIQQEPPAAGPPPPQTPSMGQQPMGVGSLAVDKAGATIDAADCRNRLPNYFELDLATAEGDARSAAASVSGRNVGGISSSRDGRGRAADSPQWNHGFSTDARRLQMHWMSNVTIPDRPINERRYFE